MGIDDIELSPDLLTSLYAHSLVGTRESFLGNNQRHITFLCEQPDLEFLPEDQLLLIGKMLSACKYSMDDVVLINTASSSISLDELKSRFQPKTIFLWGVSSEIPGIAKPLEDFTIIVNADISVIRVPSPNLMTENDAQAQSLKQKLWVCLKKLFNL